VNVVVGFNPRAVNGGCAAQVAGSRSDIVNVAVGFNPRTTGYPCGVAAERRLNSPARRTNVDKGQSMNNYTVTSLIQAPFQDTAGKIGLELRFKAKFRRGYGLEGHPVKLVLGDPES
jgi:hypothetical protein